MLPLSTMNLKELLHYTDIPECLIEPLDDLQAYVEELELSVEKADFELEAHKADNENLYKFVRAMYQSMNEETNCKELKKAINKHIDLFHIEI